MRGFGRFQKAQMKNRDARIFELCGHLRSAIDVLEQIASDPYRTIVKEASEKVPPLAPHPQEFPPEKLAYSIKEAAAAVGVGRTTLWKAITEERLLAVKLGTRTLIPSDALRAWIGSLPATRG